ncbi:MAG TPA: ABC transporter permease [Acidimicrobiales bacterium]|nr:ABC transporter permease [Acidimicrobiales bacterium]
MAKTEIDIALSGLDALEFDLPSRPSRALALWNALWPKLAAITLVLGAWQLVVWSGWKSETILPSPATVFPELWREVRAGIILPAVGVTLRRAVLGYSTALVIGCALGIAVSRQRVLRQAIGSLITGLQTMPSIAWFPAAIVLFGLNDSAIFFVVVLGAAPAIANGLIGGIDQIQPVLLKAGRSLGARRIAMWRHVILPAALPGFVGGLKQGWAFAWRSLMAGELIANFGGHRTIGFLLQNSRDQVDYPAMYAAMVVILILGIVVDSLVFGRLDTAVRRRWGLAD